MSKSVIVYKSKYGSTKVYAQWIAKKLEADIYEVNEVKVDKLLEYNNIIFGGGLYAGGIGGSAIISKNFHKLKNKNIIVFTVGLSPTEDKSIFKPAIDKNFSADIQREITFFHLRGGIDYKKLSLIHRVMMAMLKLGIAKKKPEELSDDDKLMLKTYGDKIDFVNINTATKIIEYVKNIK
ncbi:flavodoxin domain-containing protein [Clostridium gasigenes]|uniref:Protoporphyrinogen IX oxidase, menaquinone-dependent (Flavodoxin domain) n=1 Tax=Clostridium gasigenes TaxID=94869 RepID=A0A1H0MRB4_9CLOT|nr:flavodoxin domain-containing protein [Clostridium gasigenes]MBB6621978.1 flavodoxin [Clostridium gasigenes]MBU3086872.1 flavodoxin domain-containing protein [Clostridium gasigenes]MBU3131323.1 flavodoxin domain-containing protein [Clostridium gasigenes]SDO82989.1 Protoporphyrinogen IX oxidase, menaquinone-dependent (flavodoxin domain) [Clostridium gasigenes]